jgi:S1-C subfamily serine protease
MKTAAILLCSITMASFLAAPPKGGVGCQSVSDALDNALACSVMVVSEGGSGSGVIFRNGDAYFVWTDAHVVAGGKKVVREEKAGVAHAVTRVTFAPITAMRDEGEFRKSVMADVVRVSDDHDIAIFRLRAPLGSSVVFDESRPRQGSPIWHVGSMHGEMGIGSVSEGVVAFVGRLRKDFAPDPAGHAYDQACLNALPGSSGGGVFSKSSGQCYGLITEFLGPGRTYGVLCYTPSRRLRAFAVQHGCEWAMDRSVKVPAMDRAEPYVDPIPVK